MELPRQIGPYRPLEHLGSGGMGEVYLARAPDGALLAVKTIRADLLDRPKLRVRMRREAEALSRIRGEHLAELVAYDLDAAPPYLATRYVQGRSLREVVAEDGPLPPAAVWRLADGLARALAAIHEAGYVHRDLKPGNVMVVDGSPVVIDFGISHALGETRLTERGASGTPAYMAPELAAEGRAEPAGDVYAWAATVAYAATGRDAHWSALEPARLARLLFEAESLSADLRDLIDAAFAFDPRERPTARELVARLAPLAPAVGGDLHLEHPYEAGGGEVSLTLPGGRYVTLEVPPDAGPGDTLTFPGQGRPGRNGGAAGDLHLCLVSAERVLSVGTASQSAPLKKKHSKRIFAMLLVLLVVGMAAIIVRIGSTGGKDVNVSDGELPESTRDSLFLYGFIPESCRLLNLSSVQKVVPGAEIPNPTRETAQLTSCDIQKNGRMLHVRLMAVGVEPYEMSLGTAEKLFQQRLDEEERSPYSEMISRDLGLGDRSFSYVERGGSPGEGGVGPVSGAIETGVEVLTRNLNLRLILYQDSRDFAVSADKSALHESLKNLAGEIISVLPSRATVVTPGS